MADNDYSAAKEGARLALEAAAQNLGSEATCLGENGPDDTSIEDVCSWIENFRRALRHYRKYYPADAKEPAAP